MKLRLQKSYQVMSSEVISEEVNTDGLILMLSVIMF